MHSSLVSVEEQVTNLNTLFPLDSLGGIKLGVRLQPESDLCFPTLAWSALAFNQVVLLFIFPSIK